MDLVDKSAAPWSSAWPCDAQDPRSRHTSGSLRWLAPRGSGVRQWPALACPSVAGGARAGL